MHAGSGQAVCVGHYTLLGDSCRMRIGANRFGSPWTVLDLEPLSLVLTGNDHSPRLSQVFRLELQPSEDRVEIWFNTGLLVLALKLEIFVETLLLIVTTCLILLEEKVGVIFSIH